MNFQDTPGKKWVFSIVRNLFVSVNLKSRLINWIWNYYENSENIQFILYKSLYKGDTKSIFQVGVVETDAHSGFFHVKAERKAFRPFNSEKKLPYLASRFEIDLGDVSRQRRRPRCLKNKCRNIRQSVKSYVKWGTVRTAVYLSRVSEFSNSAKLPAHYFNAIWCTAKFYNA